MNPSQPEFLHGARGVVLDTGIHLSPRHGEGFFDLCGLDTTIANQDFQRNSCDLTPERIKTRNDDGIGLLIE